MCSYLMLYPGEYATHIVRHNRTDLTREVQESEIKACLEMGFVKEGEVPQTPAVNEGQENAMKASNTSDIFKANAMPEPTEPVMTTIMVFRQRRRQITLAERQQAQAQLTATTTTSQPGQPQSTTQKGAERGSSAALPDSTSGTVDTRWQLYNSVRWKKAANEEEEDQRALCAAPLRTPSPSPKLQPAGSDPSPEQTTGADAQPEFEGEDMVGTSSPAGDSKVYATPAASPPPVPEGEDGARTPPSAWSPVDDPQLPVSPKRKVETRDLDMDSSVELPALQKKAHAVAI